MFLCYILRRIDGNGLVMIVIHLPPKNISFRIRISKPCFLISEKKIILPAYGSFTGGIDSKSEIFKDVINDKYKTFILLNKNIVEVN